MKNKPTLIMILLYIMLCLTSCDNKMQYIDNETEIDETIEKAEDDKFEYTYSDDSYVKYNSVNLSNQFQYYDGCLYFNKGTLMRYNCETGNITTVCSDPLCDHKSYDCPFFMMNPFVVYKDRVFFRRVNVFDDYTEQMSYNISTAALKVHEKIDSMNGGEYLKQILIDNYRYYYDYKQKDETSEPEAVICRMNLDTGKIETVSGDLQKDELDYYIPYTQIFLFTVDSRVYFTDGKIIFSTDLDLKNRTDHITGKFPGDVYTDGEYIYYSQKQDETTDIYRMKFDGSDNTYIVTVSTYSSWQFTEKYIYYQTPDVVDIGKVRISGYASDRVELHGSEIRRCRHDGSGDELVYKFEGDMANCRIFGYTVYGNYIYGDYQEWIDKDGNGVFEEGENYSNYNDPDYKFMRIDVTTGEIYYIKAN